MLSNPAPCPSAYFPLFSCAHLPVLLSVPVPPVILSGAKDLLPPQGGSSAERSFVAALLRMTEAEEAPG